MPVTANGSNGLGGLDFILAYDPNVLSVVNVSAGPVNTGILEANTSVPGLVSVSIAATEGINSTGDVAIVSFNVIGAPGQTSELVLSNVQAFDAATLAEISATATNGTFTVASGIGTSPVASGGEAMAMALMALSLVAGIRLRKG